MISTRTKDVMRIGIIDADLVGRKKHRFPNLACEKISAYWKEKDAEVRLLQDYNDMGEFDQVYVSKVFTDTVVPDHLRESPKVHMGGTGFFFDKAPNLPDEIEHHMPDYHLYDDWIDSEIMRSNTDCIQLGKTLNMPSYMQQFKEYQGYAIGFLTRGCFRKCKFCVNQKYSHVFAHSPLSEFYSGKEKKICLLDDNFLGHPMWRPMLEELIATGKPFKFKQGLDERLLTEEKCKLLFSANYDGDYTFAFDNISDYDLIHSKLILIRKFASEKASIKFYVLVGFDGTDSQDIESAFCRISLLMKYKCLPYIMRYQNQNHSPWQESKYRGMYVAIARWANQPSMFKKMSFRQFCEANQALCKTSGKVCATMRSMIEFETEHPEIAKQYFDQRFEDQYVT